MQPGLKATYCSEADLFYHSFLSFGRQWLLWGLITCLSQTLSQSLDKLTRDTRLTTHDSWHMLLMKHGYLYLLVSWQAVAVVRPYHLFFTNNVPRYTVRLSQCHTVTLLHYHTVTLSHCHTVTLSHCHNVKLSHCHFARQSHCHTVTLSYCQTVILPHCHTVTLAHFHMVTLQKVLL